VHPTLQGVSMPDVATTPNGSDGAGMDPFYNKYVVHDVAQILLRHLPRVDITSGYWWKKEIQWWRIRGAPRAVVGSNPKIQMLKKATITKMD
jgi:hypothetical protein